MESCQLVGRSVGLYFIVFDATIEVLVFLFKCFTFMREATTTDYIVRPYVTSKFLKSIRAF